jgi:hypothetical protein
MRILCFVVILCALCVISCTADTTCPKNYFGPQCDKKCIRGCENGCDRVTGHCNGCADKKTWGYTCDFVHKVYSLF